MPRRRDGSVRAATGRRLGRDGRRRGGGPQLIVPAARIGWVRGGCFPIPVAAIVAAAAKVQWGRGRRGRRLRHVLCRHLRPVVRPCKGRPSPSIGVGPPSRLGSVADRGDVGMGAEATVVGFRWRRVNALRRADVLWVDVDDHFVLNDADERPQHDERRPRGRNRDRRRGHNGALGSGGNVGGGGEGVQRRT